MRLGRSRLSIRTRLILATALLLGAVAAAPLVLLPDRLERHAHEELERRALDIARTVGTASEVAFDFGDGQRAGEILRGLAAAGGVTYGVLWRADGSALASWGAAPARQLPATSGQPAARYEGDLLHVWTPVATPAGETGAVQLGLGLGDLARRRAESRATVGATSLAIFLVGLGVLVLVASLLTRPVRELTLVAARIARGDEGAARQLETGRGDEAGAVANALESVIDRLARQRAMLQSQSEATSEGILTLGLDGRVLTHNRRLRDLWGLDAVDVDGVPWSALRGRLERELLEGLPAWLLVEAPVTPVGEAHSIDLKLTDGRSMVVHAAAVRMPAGEPLGVGLYFRDVTRQVEDRRRIEELAADLERRVAQRTLELAAANLELSRRLEELKRTQEQLVVADRRVSLGRLAAGVAHEINNPLAYILGNLRFSADEAWVVREGLRSTEHRARLAGEAKLEEMLGALGDATEGAQRVAHIVRGLKSFARSDDDRTERVGLERAMRAALDMAGHEVRHKALVVEDFRSAPAVQANEVRLSQVLVNLLVNAGQAIEAGRVATNSVTASIWTDPQGWAVAEVRDTGAGIPPEIRDRIFDPFFTTKAQGQGTGLGLSISQGIVTSYGGTIEVESEVGRGSTFRLRFPPAVALQEPLAPSAPAPAPATGRSRLLVIDDEPLVAAAMRRQLAAAHQVTVAESGQAALDLLAAGARYEVILCDLMMPALDGVAFHAALARLDPAQADRVVFMTGGAFTADTQAFVERNQQRVLSKPVDLDALRRAIHALPPS